MRKNANPAADGIHSSYNKLEQRVYSLEMSALHERVSKLEKKMSEFELPNRSDMISSNMQFTQNTSASTSHLASSPNAMPVDFQRAPTFV